MGDENTTGDLAHEVKPVYMGDDEEFYSPYTDRHSRMTATIEIEHAEIHEGNHYFYTDYITIAGSATTRIVFEVGPVDTHFVYKISSDISGFSFKSFEDVTADEDGTIVKMRNSNRPVNGIKPTNSVIRINPSNIVIKDANDWMRRGKFGTGGTAAPQREGGGLLRSNETILTKNLKYLLEITNLSTDANDINIEVTYYHQDVS